MTVAKVIEITASSPKSVEDAVRSGLKKVSDVEDGIELVTWPLDQIDGLIDANPDASTLIGLLWLRRAQLNER